MLMSDTEHVDSGGGDEIVPSQEEIQTENDPNNPRYSLNYFRVSQWVDFWTVK